MCAEAAESAAESAVESAVEPFVPDDFIVDMHTASGRARPGNDKVRFALEGARVEPEADWIRPYWKAFYEDSKRIEEGLQSKRQPAAPDAAMQLETATYRFRVRTQLTTSASKMDVYLADASGRSVIVKGPYGEKPDIVLRHMEWKHAHGLPFIPVKIRTLIPDRWESVPLGNRNRLPRNVPAFFLNSTHSRTLCQLAYIQANCGHQRRSSMARRYISASQTSKNRKFKITF